MSSIRIIAGKHKGKLLYFSSPKIRPTGNKVRETLFNWLMFDIKNAKCLDLFAGSGALGFEAFSRGASLVTLVESNFNSYKELLTTAKQFKTCELQIINDDGIKFLQYNKNNYDIIFLDPPYTSTLLKKSIEILSHGASILTTQGLLYLESNFPFQLDNKIWQPLKEKNYGKVFFALYKKMY